MAAARVPESWLVFPIGALKTAAAIGLVLFFACAVHTHLLADDRSPQLAAAATFLGWRPRR